MKNLVQLVLKWWLIIAFAGVTFYVIYPKYESIGQNGIYINTITGRHTYPKKLAKLENGSLKKFTNNIRQKSLFNKWIAEDQNKKAILRTQPNPPDAKSLPNEYHSLVWCPRCAKKVPVFIRTVTLQDSIHGIQRKEELHCRKCRIKANKCKTLIETHVIGENEDQLKKFSLDAWRDKEESI